jgi:hypothetical protein
VYWNILATTWPLTKHRPQQYGGARGTQSGILKKIKWLNDTVNYVQRLYWKGEIKQPVEISKISALRFPEINNESTKNLNEWNRSIFTFWLIQVLFTNFNQKAASWTDLVGRHWSNRSSRDARKPIGKFDWEWAAKFGALRFEWAPVGFRWTVNWCIYF